MINKNGSELNRDNYFFTIIEISDKLVDKFNCLHILYVRVCFPVTVCVQQKRNNFG